MGLIIASYKNYNSLKLDTSVQYIHTVLFIT